MNHRLLLILLSISITCYSQHDTTSLYSKKLTIDKKSIDKGLNLKKNAIYIIDGVPFQESDSIKLDSILNSYSLDLLVDLIKLINKNRIGHSNIDVALIHFASQQSEKEIKKRLVKIRKRLVDKYHGFSQHILTDSKNPVVMVDNITIHHTQVETIINELKSNDIFFIDLKFEPQSSEFYGQNAKNGLVRIWTKKR